jgi:hypothetical protein
MVVRLEKSELDMLDRKSSVVEKESIGVLSFLKNNYKFLSIIVLSLGTLYFVDYKFNLNMDSLSNLFYKIDIFSLFPHGSEFCSDEIDGRMYKTKLVGKALVAFSIKDNKSGVTEFITVDEYIKNLQLKHYKQELVT